MAQDSLADGFVRLCISTEANWYGALPRMVVEAQSTNLAGVAYDKLYTINSILDVDALFTPGTVLYESLVMALKRNGNLYQIVAIPRADPTSGVKAEYTLPFTGPATSDGTITLFAGNSGYDIEIPVVSGDTATTIAANAAALYSANFPYAVTAATGTLTYVAKNKGTVLNNLNIVVNWKGYRGVMPTGVTVGPLTQSVAGTLAPLPSDYSTLFGECCASVYVLCSDNIAWQRKLRDWIRSGWDCSKPQCFGEGYTYRFGTTGSIIATFDNSAELSVLAACAGQVEFEWLKAVEYGGLSAATKALGHPERIVQGPVSGLLENIKIPASCSRCWSFAQYQLLQANGFVTTGPSTQGTGTLMSPYVYNDVTEWLYDERNRPNVTFRDVSSRRLATTTAIEIAEFLQRYNGLSVYYKNTKVPQGVFGTNKNLMLADIRAWTKTQVGTLFGEFDDIQKDVLLTSDFETSPPCQGVPGKFALRVKYRQPVRIREIDASLVPQLLDNCNR